MGIPATTRNPPVKRHLALQSPYPSVPTGSGNSSGCWKCGSPKTTSSMSDQIAARVKQLQEATVLMKEKLRVQEVKRKQWNADQREPHDVKLKRIKDSYSSCA